MNLFSKPKPKLKIFLLIIAGIGLGIFLYFSIVILFLALMLDFNLKPMFEIHNSNFWLTAQTLFLIILCPLGIFLSFKLDKYIKNKRNGRSNRQSKPQNQDQAFPISLSIPFSKAFTLIELLIAIAIIGILAGIVMVRMSGYTERSRIAKVLPFAQGIHSLLGADQRLVLTFNEGVNGTCPGNKDACDTSGRENHCENYGANRVNSEIPGAGEALEFNGNSDYLDCGNDPSLDITDAITIEAWVKIDSFQAAAHSGIVGTSETWNGYAITVNWTDSLSWLTTTAGGTVNLYISGADSYIGKWTHITGTYDKGLGSNQQKLYVNGKLKGQATQTGVLTNTLPILIGKTANYFNGTIDEVRIYNRAETLTEIKESYYAGMERLLAKGFIDEQEYQERFALK